MNIVAFILVIVAGALGGYEVIKSNWKSGVAWAVLFTNVALVVQFCVTHKPGSGVHF